MSIAILNGVVKATQTGILWTAVQIHKAPSVVTHPHQKWWGFVI